MSTKNIKQEPRIGGSELSGKLAAKKPKLKLFVWIGFCPDYTDDI